MKDCTIPKTTAVTVHLTKTEYQKLFKISRAEGRSMASQAKMYIKKAWEVGNDKV